MTLKRESLEAGIVKGNLWHYIYRTEALNTV